MARKLLFSDAQNYDIFETGTLAVLKENRYNVLVQVIDGRATLTCYHMSGYCPDYDRSAYHTFLHIPHMLGALCEANTVMFDDDSDINWLCYRFADFDVWLTYETC